MKISKHDLNYLENRCKDSGAPVEFIQEFGVCTSWVEQAIKHKDNDKALQNLRKLCNFYSDVEDSDYHYGVCELLDKMPGVLDNQLTFKRGSVAACTMSMIERCYMNEPRNAAKRISINNMSGFHATPMLMSEGIVEVFTALEKMSSAAYDVLNERRPKVVPAESEMALLMALDDCNIRGDQILDLIEFVDSDFAKAAKLALDRDERMLAYINKQQAQKFSESRGLHYIAVDYGASCTDPMRASLCQHDYVMNILNFEPYTESDVECEKINYLTMDIRSGTSLQLAEKILESRGFVKLWDFEKEGRFDTVHDVCWLDTATGDFFRAPSAQEDSVAYGGADIIAARVGRIPRAIFPTDVGVHGNTERFRNERTEWHTAECNYNHGCFKERSCLPEVSIEMIPWKDYPLRGMVSLPVPSMFDFTNYKCETGTDLDDEIDYILNRESYSLYCTAVAFTAYTDIQKFVPEEFQKYFVGILEDRFGAFVEMCGLSTLHPGDLSNIFRIAAAASMLDDDVIEQYWNAFCDYWNESNGFHAQITKKSGIDVRLLPHLPDVADRLVASSIFGICPAPENAEVPADAIDWMRKFGPEQYKKYGDWRLYWVMRNQWYTQSK